MQAHKCGSILERTKGGRGSSYAQWGRTDQRLSGPLTIQLSSGIYCCMENEGDRGEGVPQAGKEGVGGSHCVTDR